MGESSKVNLLRFFIYNSTFGPKEGEEEKKIVYYWAKIDETIDTQCKYVGLAEAVTHFGTIFSSSSRKTRSLSTQKTRSLFYSPEPDFWMVMTVSVPYRLVRKPGKNEDCLEFVPEDVNDDVFRAVLIRSYDMFRFFTGKFLLEDEVFSEKFRESLCKKVFHFFSRYIPTMKMSSVDLFDLMPSVQFLSLEAASFLKVQTFVNRVENHFSDVHSVTFLHQGSLVWSGLQQTETCLLYHYINTSLLPRQRQSWTDSENGVDSISVFGDVRNPFQGHRGRFLVGPTKSLRENIDPSSELLRVPVIRIPEENHLIVYGALSSIVCLTIPTSRLPLINIDFFRRLDSFLGPTMTSMSADLMDVFKRVDSNSDNSEEPNVAFVYYNSFNRALKSTVLVNSSNPNTIKVMSDLTSDMKRITSLDPSPFIELSVKTNSGQWVVAKQSDQRQVFVVVTNKNCNLIDASNEVEKLVSNEFKNVYLLEK